MLICFAVNIRRRLVSARNTKFNVCMSWYMEPNYNCSNTVGKIKNNFNCHPYTLNVNKNKNIYVY